MKKDPKWKSYFNNNHRYADLINGVGCGGKQVVKDTDLSELDTEAKGKARDLLRKTAFGANFAIVGIENQDSTDYEFPLRNMSYDLAGYQRQALELKREIRATKGKGLMPGEYMYGFRKTDKLHPTITFLIYSGQEEWDGPTHLHDMLDFSDIPDTLRKITPDYPVNIIDIRRFTNTEVFKTDVKYVFDFIRCSGDKNALLELVNNNEYYKEMDEEAFDVVTKYTNSKELVALKEFDGKDGKRDMCKAIRDLMEDSREEGREEGLDTVIRNMLRDHQAIGLICKYVGCDENYVKKIQMSLESE